MKNEQGHTFLPHTADIVVFNIHASQFRTDGAFVNMVLVKRKNDPFKGSYALPGGFLDEGETLEQCASRELKEETGIDTVKALLPIGTFSDPKRDPRGPVISTAYSAIIPTMPDRPLEVKAGDDAAECHLFRLKGKVNQSQDGDSVEVELHCHKTGETISYRAAFKIGPFCIPYAEITYAENEKDEFGDEKANGSCKLAFDHAEIIARAITKMPAIVTPTRVSSRVESDSKEN